MIRLAAGTFNWSTSEQLYPLEQTIDGNTLYAKEIDLGALPNSGFKYVAHSLPDNEKIHSFLASTWDGREGFKILNPVPFAYSADTVSIAIQFDASNVILSTWTNWSFSNGTVRVVYAK